MEGYLSDRAEGAKDGLGRAFQKLQLPSSTLVVSGHSTVQQADKFE
jgi:hypothetical protein